MVGFILSNVYLRRILPSSESLRPATVADAGTYTQSSIVGFQTYLDAAVAAPTSVKVFFDEIDAYQTQATSVSTAFVDAAVPAKNQTTTSIYAVAFVEASNAATTGRSTFQNVTMVLPVNRDVNNADKALHAGAGDDITVINGIGGTVTFSDNATTITTVDHLVAAMNGDTTVAGVTLSADRDAFHEQVITVAYTYSNGNAATTSGTAGNLYFTYGTDPESGAALAGQASVAGASASGAIAVDIATALNALTNAYVATGTADGKVTITALVSGTLLEDRGPIPHDFQTLAVLATSDSSTVDLAGETHKLLASATSNVTAVASSLYNFGTSSANYSGVRVTVKNNSTASNLSGMTITKAAANSTAFKGDGQGYIAALLVAGTNIVASSINSSTLDYVAAFSDVESPVSVASTAGTTDRTGWLSN
jgi:predicted flap endonuclease-1-like 5' DNA nuclease